MFNKIYLLPLVCVEGKHQINFKYIFHQNLNISKLYNVCLI